MKKIVFNCSLLMALIIFNACEIIPDIEEVDTITEELTPTINIPDGFDFSTHHEVQVNINDNANYVRYDIYAYTDKLVLTGAETFQNQSGETVTEPVYRNDVLNKLIFSGAPVND